MLTKVVGEMGFGVKITPSYIVKHPTTQNILLFMTHVHIATNMV